MTLEVLKANYADDRMSVVIRETKAKMALLVEQLRNTQTADLLDNPEVSGRLHSASHNAWIAASGLADSTRQARHRFAGECERIKQAMWEAHLLVDTIVRDIEKDRGTSSLIDPPNYARHLVPLAQEVQGLVERLDCGNREFEGGASVNNGNDGIPVWVLLATVFSVLMLTYAVMAL